MTDYKYKYEKYKYRYTKLKYGGQSLPPVKDYHIGIIQMYHEDLSTLKALEIGIGDSSDSILFSKEFKSYIGQEEDCSNISKAKELCKKYDCKIDFTTRPVKDIVGNFDVVLFYNSFDKRHLEHTVKNLLNKDGIILIDEPKSSKYNKYLKGLNKGLKMRHFDKKNRDVYIITRPDASFNIRSGRLPIPPAERWY